MAKFLSAIEKTLAHEGGYAYVKSTGECVNFGITHWFLRGIGVFPKAARNVPATEDEIRFIRSMTRESAVEIYRKHFWELYRIGEIDDQNLADKVFDLTVNMGPGGVTKKDGRPYIVRGAIVRLQEAVNTLRGREIIKVDGNPGPATIAAVNTTNPEALLDLYKRLIANEYRNRAHGPLADNLDAWLRRLESA